MLITLGHCQGRSELPMLYDMRVNDVELTPAEIGALENADEIAHLFASLGTTLMSGQPSLILPHLDWTATTCASRFCA